MSRIHRRVGGVAAAVLALLVVSACGGDEGDGGEGSGDPVRDGCPWVEIPDGWEFSGPECNLVAVDPPGTYVDGGWQAEGLSMSQESAGSVAEVAAAYAAELEEEWGGSPTDDGCALTHDYQAVDSEVGGGRVVGFVSQSMSWDQGFCSYGDSFHELALVAPDGSLFRVGTQGQLCDTSESGVTWWGAYDQSQWMRQECHPRHVDLVNQTLELAEVLLGGTSSAVPIEVERGWPPEGRDGVCPWGSVPTGWEQEEGPGSDDPNSEIGCNLKRPDGAPDGGAWRIYLASNLPNDTVEIGTTSAHRATDEAHRDREEQDDDVCPDRMERFDEEVGDGRLVGVLWQEIHDGTNGCYDDTPHYFFWLVGPQGRPYVVEFTTGFVGQEDWESNHAFVEEFIALSEELLFF